MYHEAARLSMPDRARTAHVKTPRARNDSVVRERGALILRCDRRSTVAASFRDGVFALR
jgi:hypothetical protein